MKVILIVNPVSGGGNARERAGRLQSAFERAGYETEVRVTGKPGDAEAWAGEYGADDCIVSVGGDGTIRELVTGLDLADPPRLMVYPNGTGNVIAGELRMPSDPAKLVALLEGGNVRWIDVGSHGSSRFLSMAGIGFDAEVVKAFHRTRDSGNGMVTYVNDAVSELMIHRATPVDVYVDGERRASDVTFVQVANARNYGGPMIFSPHARPDDGRFNVSWLDTPGRPALFRLLVSGLIGIPSLNPDYRTVQGTRVELDPADRRPDVQLDGDPATEDDLQFRIHPRAVPFFTPLSGSETGDRGRS